MEKIEEPRKGARRDIDGNICLGDPVLPKLFYTHKYMTIFRTIKTIFHSLESQPRALSFLFIYLKPWSASRKREIWFLFSEKNHRTEFLSYTIEFGWFECQRIWQKLDCPRSPRFAKWYSFHPSDCKFLDFPWIAPYRLLYVPNEYTFKIEK